ncbi:MAG TPA: cytochrome ubiquinol oxidase subunit I [Candidatus Tumulicola sp.]|jgi:cytochrome d ubiquinol oxidase subunit I
MDAILADRIQFAFTIAFHYLFPIGTMGLAPFVAAYTWKAARDGDEATARAAAFWTKIFAINFAVGVVTGIPMEFQFGTNWAGFSRASGAVVGQPLAMEGVFAFFLESIFLGALLYGARGRPSRFKAWSAVLVCVGAWLSGYFIVATDAWMQHPVGFAHGPHGTIELINIFAVLGSRWAVWQYFHTIVAAIVAGAFIVAGIGAYYVLAGRETALGGRFVTAGTIVAFVFSAAAAFPTGDLNADNVTRYQPAKLAAMEGLFKTTTGAPLAILGMPDTENQTLIDPIYVPGFLSYLAYGNFSAGVKGLDAFAREYWPPVGLTYYAYHVMVGLGTIFGGLSGIALIALLLKRLHRTRAILWALMLIVPFPYIANEAGWMVAEVGRQPWIVYGVMLTADAASPTVNGGETLFTTIGFAGMYCLLGILFLTLMLRTIGDGLARA